ncbi:MAG: hypothetical protein SH819_04690 [Cytophagales bacterium]|nr:hypothetical protein [Cytophagales bacterium]
MNKNIIIAILGIITLVSLSFGYVQMVRADKNFELASINREKMEELRLQLVQAREIADVQRAAAEANALEAVRQNKLAQEALAKKRPTN